MYGGILHSHFVIVVSPSTVEVLDVLVPILRSKFFPKRQCNSKTKYFNLKINFRWFFYSPLGLPLKIFIVLSSLAVAKIEIN